MLKIVEKKLANINLEKIIFSTLILVILMILITAQNKLILIYKPVLILFFILPFLIKMDKGKINIKINKLSIFWLIMVGYFCTSFIYTINLKDTSYNLAIFIVGFTFLVHMFSDKFYEVLIKCIKIVVIFCAITIILSAIFPQPFADIMTWFKIGVPEVYDSATNGYATGILFEKARAAFVVNIGIVIIVTTMLSKKEYSKMNILELIILFTALFLTGKRMLTAIAVIVSIIMFIIISNKNKQTYKRFFIILCIAILMIAIMCLIFPKTSLVFKRMMNIGNTIGGREVFWNTAIEMFKESPIIGKGIGTFNSYLADTGFTYYGMEWTSHAHNSYLQILAETGILGLLMMLVSIIYTLYNTIILLLKNYKNTTSKEEIVRKTQIYISLAIQMVFLFYAITGNPFHNFPELYIYIIFISIINCEIYKKQDMNFNKEKSNDEN